MTTVNINEIREKCRTMNDAWAEGAKTVEFNGETQTAFAAEIADAEIADAEIADLEARLKLKCDVRDGKYVRLNEKRLNVSKGVAGDENYGDDSPLYGAMGFVRKSDRASGLTGKKFTLAK